MSDQLDTLNTLDTSAFRRCAGANIRRTDRVVTQFYDAILAPSGLSAPQFGLLATLADVAPTTINRLAEVMVMDRTTLTRNLGLLTKQRLVRSEEGADRRLRVVQLTQEGEKALRRAWPLWQEARSRIERALGRERLDALLAELSAVRELAR
jgi:DNA-binding MarR family transcriptional regulator